MIGTVRNSYVRKNSIHHTYNRAVAIHGVSYFRVQDNVAFETMGHTFFIEDGIETKNILTGNLGANTRPSFVSEARVVRASTLVRCSTRRLMDRMAAFPVTGAADRRCDSSHLLDH